MTILLIAMKSNVHHVMAAVYDFSDGGQCEDCGGAGDVCVDDDGDYC